MVSIKKLIYSLLREKFFFAVVIAALAVLLLDLVYIVLLAVSAIRISVGAAFLKPSFLTFSITTVVLNLLLGVALTVVLVLRGKK